ncbi:MAG: hypothetical protein ACFCD0_15675 [Gemmataceae bacterium]
MNATDRTKLSMILQTFDEVGLVALANKGLLRRATKDLEAGKLTHEETENAILVRGSGWTVTMPVEGPTKATDDTKATGVTRQIVAATIYLRDNWASTISTNDPGDISTPEDAVARANAKPKSKAKGTKDTKGNKGSAQLPKPKETASGTPSAEIEQTLLKLKIDDLQKWANKSIVHEGLALLRSDLAIELESHAGLTIRLSKHDVEARFFPTEKIKQPSQLLDHVLTTVPKSQHKQWVIAAIVALHRHRGQDISFAEDLVAQDATGAPRTRNEILQSAQSLLESMVTTGLAHPSKSIFERLSTLSVSATGVHLPRLSRFLRALADDVSLLLQRDACGDTSRLLERICFTYALTLAIRNAGQTVPVALVGRHRTEYQPVGDLILAGVGAYPWQTASGYEGVTVLFWDVQENRFRTFTVSRPTTTASLDLWQTYNGESVWSGGSPSSLGRSLITLKKAKANSMGRLSSSQESKAEILEPTDSTRIQFPGREFSDWAELQSYALTTYPLGLIEKDPIDRTVILKPREWGPRHFDELQQRFVWNLIDETGNVLALTLPWLGVNENAIEFLEAVKPDRDKLTHVVCRLVFLGTGIVCEPLSLLSSGIPKGDRVLNPAFDKDLIKTRNTKLLEHLRKKYGRDKIATTMTAEDLISETAASYSELYPKGIQTRLAEVERTLLRLAESGVNRLQDESQRKLQQLAQNLERIGFQELAVGLEQLASAKARAHGLIWCGYLAQLYRQACGLKLSG